MSGERMPTAEEAALLSRLQVPFFDDALSFACEDEGWMIARRHSVSSLLVLAITDSGRAALARYREAQGGGEG